MVFDEIVYPFYRARCIAVEREKERERESEHVGGESSESGTEPKERERLYTSCIYVCVVGERLWMLRIFRKDRIEINQDFYKRFAVASIEKNL